MLQNAAEPGLRMPFIGAGTGAYRGAGAPSCAAYPECWSEAGGCSAAIAGGVSAWLRLGGRRLDCANSYGSQRAVAAGMAAAGLPREELFVLQKTGSTLAMGYEDTLAQMADILADMNLTRVELLLVHWPTSAAPSVEPACNVSGAAYDAVGCRLATWRAYVELFRRGTARAIGVSNYNASHLQEIIDAGLPLPAVNQLPLHIYNAAAQRPLLDFCRAHGILVVAYSPLGVPDWHAFPVPPLPARTPLADPVVLAVTAAHAPASPAQVALAWLRQRIVACRG